MSNDNTLDYGDDTPQAQSPEESFPRLNALVRLAHEFERQVEEFEVKLADAQKALRGIVEDQLPKMMEECGVTTFTTADGIEIGLQKKVETSIPAPRKSEAWKWFRSNGHAAVVKCEVSVAFGIGTTEQSKALANELTAKYPGSVSVAEKVEPATVKAIISRRLEAGEAVPMDLFGVRRLTVAKFKTK